MLSEKDLELAQRFGGADLTNYEVPDELRSCDKPDHFARSLVNQPNHCKMLQDITSLQFTMNDKQESG